MLGLVAGSSIGPRNGLLGSNVRYQRRHRFQRGSRLRPRVKIAAHRRVVVFTATCAEACVCMARVQHPQRRPHPPCCASPVLAPHSLPYFRHPAEFNHALIYMIIKTFKLQVRGGTSCEVGNCAAASCHRNCTTDPSAGPGDLVHLLPTQKIRPADLDSQRSTRHRHIF